MFIHFMFTATILTMVKSILYHIMIAHSHCMGFITIDMLTTNKFIAICASINCELWAAHVGS